MSIDHILTDAARKGLEISLTPVGGIRLFCKDDDSRLLEEFQPLIEANCQAVIDLLKARAGHEIVVGGDVAVCPSCGTLKVPSAAAQVSNLCEWQRGQTIIMHWSEAQLQRLQNALRPGDLIVRSYSQSVVIRDTAGRLRDYMQNDA